MKVYYLVGVKCHFVNANPAPNSQPLALALRAVCPTQSSCAASAVPKWLRLPIGQWRSDFPECMRSLTLFVTQKSKEVHVTGRWDLAPYQPVAPSPAQGKHTAESAEKMSKVSTHFF